MTLDRQTIQNIKNVIISGRKALLPPPQLTVSEWADRERKLSPESSAEPGQWNTDRAPYQRGMMDAYNDETVHTIVIMSSAQIGKNEVINNIIGYVIDQNPGPMLLIEPTVDMAETISKDRIAPMLRDTPCLRDKVKDPRSRDSGNTLLHKQFPGGHLTMAGANSPAGLASRPIRDLFCDEVDRYPISAGTEGDPVNLATKRTATFWNAKRVLPSTPTVKGLSRIERAFEESDKRYYLVPCPSCEEYQRLLWANIKWPEDKPEEAYYVCIHCGSILTDADKPRMLAEGKWEASSEFKGTAGFHISELYSPWRRWGQVAVDFIAAKKSPETLKTWVNTSLGETWEEDGDGVEADSLIVRREHYDLQNIPQEVCVITAGVDVQDNRIECELVGWGIGFENWSLDYRVFYGDPGQQTIWKELDDYLQQSLGHPSGTTIRIACTCVDSGGHFTSQVYKFCKVRERRRVFAIKGKSQAGSPIISRPNKKNKGKVLLFSLGVDTAKELVYSRMRISDPGPGYCHFSVKANDEEYFKQLTIEKAQNRFQNGHAVRIWVKPSGARNEALDCRVYATAAVEILNPKFETIAEKLTPVETDSDSHEDEKEEPKQTVKPKSKISPRRKTGGFVNRWKQ